MIEGILFDYGGVIGLQKTDLYTAVADQFGIRTDTLKDSARDLIHLSQIDALPQELFFGMLGERTLIDSYVLSEIWLETFESIGTVDIRVVDLIKSLEGFKLGLFSNRSNIYDADHDVASHFDQVIASCDTGYRKPHPMSYISAVNLMGIPADKLLMIDDQEKNLVPARNIGMQTHLYRGYEKLKQRIDQS